MAKQTVTTRNKKFNEYDYDYIINDTKISTKATVNSMTATKDNPNIKLLDLTDAVVKSGKEIYEDAQNNTNLIETNLGFDSKFSEKIKNYLLNPDQNPLTAAEKGKLDDRLFLISLATGKHLTLDSIKKSMIIDYSTKLTGEKYNIYGAPDKVVLNNKQNYNNCGVESTLNTLAMAGIINMDENLKDQKKIEKKFLTSILERGIADDSGKIGVLDEADGGTLPDYYRDILEYFGIASKAYYMSNKTDGIAYKDLNELGYKISQGYGAVVGVSSSKLWNETQSESGKIKVDHAVAITGVVYADGADPAKKDNNGKYANSPVGFYIHDSGAFMTRFITLEDFKEATLYDYLYGDKDDEANKKLSTLMEYDAKADEDIKKTEKGIFITITEEPIKTNTFNINATGDKYANTIWGNNQNNIIKGMNGDDTLYGGGGNDEIRGGSGNDVIVGNNVSSTDILIFKNYVDDKTKTILSNIQISTENLKGVNDIYGDTGNDIIIGGNNADLIYGGKGNDYIYGGDGRNAIYGGAGNDIIIGGYDNDKLFADAGNDTIYGYADEDTIDGGNGNDHIYGGGGFDRIETGKGNDTVYFEGDYYGIDIVSSKGGSTTLKFIDAKIDDITISNGMKASDMFFSLEKSDDEDSKYTNLAIKYDLTEEEPKNGVEFLNFHNTKNNKFSNVALIDVNEDVYKISATSSKKATVANIKNDNKTVTIGANKYKNSEVNNILLATNSKGTTITTSVKNDIVTMVGVDDIKDVRSKDESLFDKITYTGGKDKYISEERNTYYTVNKFDNNTSLSIYDNVAALEKYVYDETGERVKDENGKFKTEKVVSTDDKLYFTEAQDNLNIFFDVKLKDGNGYTTKNSGLYILSSADGTVFENIVNKTASKGFIYIDSFFSYDDENSDGYKYANPTTESTFFGNGQIETIYKGADDESGKFNYTSDIVAIADKVAGWLNDNTKNSEGYTSAFAAFKGKEGDIAALVQCYTNA